MLGRLFFTLLLGFSSFSGVKLAVTLPKFNSSPPKIGRNPKGKSSSNHHFSGVGHVDFGGCFSPQDRLLVLDCSKRFTAEEALRHPWLLAVNASAEKVGLERVAPFRPKQNASIPAPCQRDAKWFRLTGVNKNHPLGFKDGTPTWRSSYSHFVGFGWKNCCTGLQWPTLLKWSLGWEPREKCGISKIKVVAITCCIICQGLILFVHRSRGSRGPESRWVRCTLEKTTNVCATWNFVKMYLWVVCRSEHQHSAADYGDCHWLRAWHTWS